MQIAKVSTKGKMTVPKLIREVMGITEGDNIAFLLEGSTIVVKRVEISGLQQTHGVPPC